MHLQYPLDIQNRTIPEFAKKNIYHAFEFHYKDDGKLSTALAVVVNGESIYPTYEPRRLRNLKDSDVARKAKHPNNFIGYQYEGFAKIDRQRMTEHDYYIAVYLIIGVSGLALKMWTVS